MGLASPPQEPHGKVGSNLPTDELLCSFPWKKGKKKLTVRVSQPGDCPVTWNVSFYPVKTENCNSTHKNFSSKVSCCRVQGKQIDVTNAFSEVWFHNVLCVFRAPVNTVGIMGLSVCRRQGKNLNSATKPKTCKIRKNEASSYCIE